MSAVVIVGVGNRLRGDDAVGGLVIDELEGFEGAVLLDAGSAPENYIEPIAKEDPERILFVDACDFGASAGEYRLFTSDQFESLSFGLLSTHTLPLTLTAELLRQRTHADIRLLGIQPERIDFNTGLSEPVQRALPEVVRFVKDWAATPAG